MSRLHPTNVALFSRLLCAAALPEPGWGLDNMDKGEVLFLTIFRFNHEKMTLLVSVVAQIA